MRLPAVTLTTQDLSHLEDAIKKEWLITNGLGGYASSTVLGVNTRKYHGLLVAALHPPGDRTVCLSKLDEDLIVGDSVFRLGTNEFQGNFFPNGHVFLKEFCVAPYPKYTYDAGGLRVEKTIFMPRGKNAVATLYRLTNGNGVDMKARIFPILPCRHFHAVIDHQANPLNLQQKHDERSVEVTCPNPKATTIVSATEGKFLEKPNNVNSLFYREEAQRGESSLDNCYQPGYFEIPISPQTTSEFTVVAASDENPEECRKILESMGADPVDVAKLFELELKRKEGYLYSYFDSQKNMPAIDWLGWALLAADSFIARGSGDSRFIMAGYHWFEPWGRDTFISLPGLLLVTGRFSDAEKVLVHFAEYVKQGLIPNFIPDDSTVPAYNTVDASLWYVNAVLQYVKHTGDFRFVEENLWETLQAIIENHERGTAFGIHVDNDGLLAHGQRLTWMDAEVDGEAVTPRAGKAVEIQALWYNALKTVQLFADRFERKTLSWRCSDMAAKARGSFDRKFWNQDRKCLFDVVEQSGVDVSIRPNQIIAAALDFPILHPDKAEPVVDLVQRELLTSCGLRTLARSDPKYQGTYEGTRRSRDQAYHNGTVWPWLLGPFTTAFLKARGYAADQREFAFTNFILPLFSTKLLEAGLGTLSEVFDGDPPHKPGGCISQAWSVAELLRAYVEDVLRIRPKYEKEVLQLKP
jgi:predicted glycogen debranching enzyme